MGLLDNITKAQGQGNANYLKGGRHVGKITRVSFRPEEHDLGAGFRVDVEIEKSQDPAFSKGMLGTANVNFKKFKNEALANMRRMLTAAATSKGIGPGEDGRCTEGDITKVFAERLCGPEQPLTGAIVTVIGVTKRNQTTGGEYTLYELVVPSEADLAGLD